MPTPIELVESSADADYEVRMFWTFKANLADPPTPNYESPELIDVPLSGTWHFGMSTKADKLVTSVRHDFLAKGKLGNEVGVQLRLEIMTGGQAKEIKTSSWGPEPVPDLNPKTSKTYGGYDLSLDLDKISKDQPWFQPFAKQYQTYRLTASLRRSPSFVQASKPSALSMISLLAASDPDLSPTSKDTCLAFPRVGTAGLRLWTSAAFLRKASPYFTAMFNPGCVETVPRRAKRQRKEDVKPIIDLTDDAVEGKDWDDSDDETDAYLAQARGAQPEDTELDVEYRQITINETAFTTYRAVLFYLKSGHIAFAPLRSSFVNPHPADEHTSRTDFLRGHTKKKPELPLPASPKSVYRLAHLLGLEELKKLALTSLATSLTVSGAISELFSPASMAYDELRKVLRSFVLKNFDAIRSDPTWKEQQVKAAHGELEGPALITMELLMEMADAKKSG